MRNQRRLRLVEAMARIEDHLPQPLFGDRVPRHQNSDDRIGENFLERRFFIPKAHAVSP